MSATTSATQDGSVVRIFMKDQFIYTSTAFKGLQVIDIQQAINEYQATPPGQFGGAITIEGNGFALDAVVNTIPVSLPLSNGSTYQALMMSVKAADYPTAAPDPNNPSAPVPTHTYIVATGRLPLVVADPVQSSLNAVVYPGKISSGLALQDTPLIDGVHGTFKMTQGTAVALGFIPKVSILGFAENQPIAVLVGFGNLGSMLGVVNMTDPRNPQTQGFVQLIDKAKRNVSPVDVIIKDNLAVVGTSTNEVLLVDITDPNNPFVAGEIDGNAAGNNQVVGDRLALTDDGLLVTSSWNSNIGGVHTVTFGSQCAGFRKSLPSSPTLPQFTNDSHLAWTVSGGFAQPLENGGGTFNQDGLVLTDVKLGRRNMAQTISLPYVTIARSNGSALRCNLFTSNDNACTPAAPGVNPRSHLFKYRADFSPDGTNYFYEAQFLIDYLDGNPDKNPDIPDSCVLLTQRYELNREGLAPLEPFGKFPSALFKPLVKYTYFTDPGGPTLQALTAAQRLHFEARTPINATPRPAQPPFTASLKAPVNATMMSCDPTPVDLITGGLPCVPQILSGGSAVIGLLTGHNPLLTEQYIHIIQNGQPNQFNDPVTGAPTIMDNYHQTPTPVNIPDQGIDEPGAVPPTFGCPQCVHIHWRWTKAFNQFPLTLTTNPNFDAMNGNERIWPNSTQNVDVAVLRSGGADEQQPAGTVSDLFVNQLQGPLGNDIQPSHLISNGQATATPVFWYIATGNQNSDTFFYHGLGFGGMFANRVTVPAAGQGSFAVNVEHTRDVQYTIALTRLDLTIPVPLPPPLPPYPFPYRGSSLSKAHCLPAQTTFRTSLQIWRSSQI